MKKLKMFVVLTITFYHTFCFACMTDVDVFNWKNVNLKGIRVVEFDPIQSQVLGITYHYNLQPHNWYPLRNSGQSPQKTILYTKNNGDIIIDQEFVGSIRTCGKITVSNHSENPTCTLPDYSASEEGEMKVRRFFPQETPSLYKTPSIYLFDAQNTSTQQSFNKIIPDAFYEKCLAKRYSIHPMQIRNSTAASSLVSEAQKMLESDRNSEKGILGELVIDLFVLAQKYGCKLSVKDEDEHHGVYDGAYIPIDTDEPSTLVLTESKYKKGNTQKLLNRFMQSYYPTFQKLWNSQGENAALKRRTAFIMRYAALQYNQSIYALINQGMPKVSITTVKINIDSVPFVSVFLTTPSIKIQNHNSRPIVPGPSPENARKIVKLAYGGRNHESSESLININIWFGFNEKYSKGGHKYVLKTEMKNLTPDQLEVFRNNFMLGIQKLLESNNLTEFKKEKIREIAGYSPSLLMLQTSPVQVTQSDVLQSTASLIQLSSGAGSQLNSLTSQPSITEVLPSHPAPSQIQPIIMTSLEPIIPQEQHVFVPQAVLQTQQPITETTLPSYLDTVQTLAEVAQSLNLGVPKLIQVRAPQYVSPVVQNHTSVATQINTGTQFYPLAFQQAYPLPIQSTQTVVPLFNPLFSSPQQVVSHFNPITSQAFSIIPHSSVEVSAGERYFTETLYQTLLRNLEIRFNFDYKRISKMAGFSGINGKRDFQSMKNPSYRNKMTRWNLLIRTLQNENYSVDELLN